jgi:2-polyprenyl-3-methyl-5-hydroxy-6-metoxy-1,4-benzoquinol methylase
MSGKTLASHYVEFYEKASAIPQQADADEIELFASLLPAGKSLNVLDLGCAEGKLALTLAARGHAVTAADISEKQMEKAAAAANMAGAKLETARCDIEAGPGPLVGRTFDAIYLMDVIEHLKNPVVALENIRPLLADNGALYIHTPNVFALDRLTYYLLRPRRLVDFRENRRLGDLHFQTYDYMTLEKTLNFLGFKIARLVPTRLSVPYLFRTRRLARWFPFMADTLLAECRKAPPIDVDGQIEFWEPETPTPSFSGRSRG